MSTTNVVFADPSARACVRAFITRDTGLGAPPQLNRFPVAPFCTITWFVEGRTFEGAAATGVELDRIVIGGPVTGPMLTFNPGRTHAFMIVFFPDAFKVLTGLDPAALADRLVPARETLPREWREFADDVLAMTDDATRIARAESFIAERWALCDGARIASNGSWLQRLQHAIGASALSERQFERKVKQMAGQSMRSLRCADRFERAALNARAAAEGGAVDWPGVADESGYSDQSHLCREFRKMSGATPSELLDARNDDESYWLFRAWR